MLWAGDIDRIEGACYDTHRERRRALPKQKPWYRDGLKFECQRCSKCCRGEPGYVWTTDAEIDRMAEVLGLTSAEFRSSYVRRVGDRLSLKEFPGGDCVLWGGEGRGCLVYAVRPVQCQTFPFWDEHLRAPGAWADLADYCPGVNKGVCFSAKEVAKRLKKRR